MVNRVRKWFWTKVAEWKYRNHEYDEVCCCGNNLNKKYHTILGYYYTCPDYYCSRRCAKEYAVTSYVESKLKSSRRK